MRPILEQGPHSFRGGEEAGGGIFGQDVLNQLMDALLAERYGKLQRAQAIKPNKKADRTYHRNEDFWNDGLSATHFPGANVILQDFHVTEWLPFAPGRYFTPDAAWQRQKASRYIAKDRDEYIPEGKSSMVRGGIGAIRLGEKLVGSELIYFLGASSNGIAHQGIPIALPDSEYRRVIQTIKDEGGCRAQLVGTLRTITDELPNFSYGPNIPKYCFFTEEVRPGEPSGPEELLTTTAVMFGLNGRNHSRWGDGSSLLDKSWTFCSFHPGASKAPAQTAASWLYDYATRYSHKNPNILTDFDEHYSLFTCHVEFPLKDIVRGEVDWETLHAYSKLARGTYIETYIETYIREQTNVAGDKIDVHGSGNTIVNHSTVNNAFNKVKAGHSEEVAKALLDVETAINKSANKEAAENFESFSDELTKPEPKKSLLKTLWQGTLAALPTLKELPGVIDKVSALFA